MSLDSKKKWQVKRYCVKAVSLYQKPPTGAQTIDRKSRKQEPISWMDCQTG